MTKSQNTKNEQQNNLCITSEQLTEQWKKGKLPSGEYYIKIEGVEDRACYFTGFGFAEAEAEDVEQILAPVPDYEEYQKLLSDQLAKNEGEEINAELEARLKKTQELELELRKENAQLKDLLKEVLRHELSLKEISELTRKISEVLK